MNLKEKLEHELNYCKHGLITVELVEKIFTPLAEKLVNCNMSMYPGGISFWCSTREELQTILTFAQKWTKSESGQYINYYATLDNELSVNIYATDGALPATCHVVEEEILVPEHTAKVGKVVCHE